jgi:NAD(P)-dependent dehydrogenase (short-subunit alcohol dehydrogenase family)
VLVPGPLLKSTPEDARAIFDTNVFGSLRVARAYAPILAGEGGGALVNMHSLFSWATGAGSYGASKASLWSLTNSLRLELAGQNTHVLGVHVGFVDTEMVAAIDAPKISPDLVAEKIIEALLAGQDEVLADRITEQAKAALSGPAGQLALDRLARPKLSTRLREETPCHSGISTTLPALTPTRKNGNSLTASLVSIACPASTW